MVVVAHTSVATPMSNGWSMVIISLSQEHFNVSFGSVHDMIIYSVSKPIINGLPRIPREGVINCCTIYIINTFTQHHVSSYGITTLINLLASTEKQTSFAL